MAAIDSQHHTEDGCAAGAQCAGAQDEQRRLKKAAPVGDHHGKPRTDDDAQHGEQAGVLDLCRVQADAARDAGPERDAAERCDDREHAIGGDHERAELEEARIHRERKDLAAQCKRFGGKEEEQNRPTGPCVARW